MKRKPKRTSTLDSLMARGVIWWDEWECQYMGKASDGKTVMLGHNTSKAEGYLNRCPNPTDW
jgi:hypothetical protein